LKFQVTTPSPPVRAVDRLAGAFAAGFAVLADFDLADFGLAAFDLAATFLVFFLATTFFARFIIFSLQADLSVFSTSTESATGQARQ
jgi:hypothetical protein